MKISFTFGEAFFVVVHLEIKHLILKRCFYCSTKTMCFPENIDFTSILKSKKYYTKLCKDICACVNLQT